MRSDAPGADVLAAGSLIRTPMVRSWLGAELLADAVPITGGRCVWSAAQEVPGSVSLTVPRSADGVDWLPRSPRDPLARFGQTLEVLVRFEAPVSGMSWDIRQGQFLIADWAEQGDGSVTVNGKSMFQVIEDDRLVSPMPSRRGGSMVSEARRLSSASLGMVVDPGLTDRGVPVMSWPESRLEALYEIADAWPARLREDAWGRAVWLPPLPSSPSPVLTIEDGVNGTVVSAPRSDTRAGVYNRVVVRGQESTDSGSPAFQGVADVPAGPMATSGAYRTVTEFFTSPLVTSVTQARQAALSRVQKSAVASFTLPVEMAPDPRIELDDPVAVRYDGALHWGWVTGIDFPLTVGDGPMRLDVGVAA